MSKKKEYGVCKICGKQCKLTFEHVPPGSTFNKKAATVIRLDDVLKAQNDGSMPWELKGVPGHISQRGKGGYYLCEECNNKTGAWYGKHYKRFAQAILYAALKMQEDNLFAVDVALYDMRALAVYKQVLAMFCDINLPGFATNEIRSFLLNKNSSAFNTEKYKIYMYIPNGDIGKQAPLSAKFTIGGDKPLTIFVSEITAFPVGFALYRDIPDGFTPQGTDISELASRKYDEKTNLQLPLYRLDVNTMFPADYRSKAEIVETVAHNRAWEKEHLGKGKY